MERNLVTIQLPAGLYTELEALAAREEKSLTEVIARLVTDARAAASGQGDDPVFELIGAFRSEQPLIDGIPVSEDPELYRVAGLAGDGEARLHAWELAPERYMRAPDGRAVRRHAGDRRE